jgi:hypothetical protein
MNSLKINIGNGYGQYCLLDDSLDNYVEINKPKPKIQEKILLNTSSDDKKEDKNEKNARTKLFITSLYVTTVVIIAFEYWYCLWTNVV